MKIDLSSWSDHQICEFHNHVLKQGTNYTEDDGYNYHLDQNDAIVMLAKQTLIDRGTCSTLVLKYRGKL
tara:strand:- start:73 stop:279 length:207 start_codon:yes stop_codon:yes gene_type:complete